MSVVLTPVGRAHGGTHGPVSVVTSDHRLIGSLLLHGSRSLGRRCRPRWYRRSLARGRADAAGIHIPRVDQSRPGTRPYRPRVVPRGGMLLLLLLVAGGVAAVVDGSAAAAAGLCGRVAAVAVGGVGCGVAAAVVVAAAVAKRHRL